MRSRRLKRLIGCLMVMTLVLSQATTSAFAITSGEELSSENAKATSKVEAEQAKEPTKAKTEKKEEPKATVKKEAAKAETKKPEVKKAETPKVVVSSNTDKKVLSYGIAYYKGNELADYKMVKQEVSADSSSDKVTVEKDIEIPADKFKGYTYDTDKTGTVPQKGQTIESGTEVKVYYSEESEVKQSAAKADSDKKVLSYGIAYYKGSELADYKMVKQEVAADSDAEQVEVQADISAPADKFKGYTLNEKKTGDLPKKGETIETGTEVAVYYAKAAKKIAVSGYFPNAKLTEIGDTNETLLYTVLLYMNTGDNDSTNAAVTQQIKVYGTLNEDGQTFDSSKCYQYQVQSTIGGYELTAGAIDAGSSSPEWHNKQKYDERGIEALTLPHKNNLPYETEYRVYYTIDRDGNCDKKEGNYKVEHWLLDSEDGDKQIGETKKGTGALINGNVQVAPTDLTKLNDEMEYSFVEYRVNGNKVENVSSVANDATIRLCYKEKSPITVNVTVDHRDNSNMTLGIKYLTKTVQPGETTWKIENGDLDLTGVDMSEYELDYNSSDGYNAETQTIVKPTGERIPLEINQLIAVGDLNGSTSTQTSIILKYKKKSDNKEGSYTIKHMLKKSNGSEEPLGEEVSGTGALNGDMVTVLSDDITKKADYKYEGYRVGDEGDINPGDIVTQVKDGSTIYLYYTEKTITQTVSYTVVHKTNDTSADAPGEISTPYSQLVTVNKDETPYARVNQEALNPLENFTTNHYEITSITTGAAQKNSSLVKPERVTDGTIITVLYEKAKPTKKITYTVEYRDWENQELIKDMPEGTQAKNIYEKLVYEDQAFVKIEAEDITELNIANYKFHSYYGNGVENVEALPEVQDDTTIILYYTKDKDEPEQPEQVLVSYTVAYQDTEGKSLSADKVIKGYVDKDAAKELTVGEEDLAAPPIDGYQYTGSTIPAELKVGDTVADAATVYLIYKKDQSGGAQETEKINYTIQYYKDNIKADSESVAVEVVKGATQAQVDKTKINVLNRYAGYTCTTTLSQIPAMIANNGVINVYYASNAVTPPPVNPDVPSNPGGDDTKKEAAYKVEYYYEEGGEYSTTPTATADRKGIVGEKAVVTDADKVPAADKADYSFDEYNPANVLEANINAEGTTTLKVYFTGGSQYYMEGTLNITNAVYKDHEEWATNKTFYAGVFEDASCTTPVTDADGNAVIIPINMGGNYQAQASGSVPTTAEGQSWYATEVNADGSIMQETELFKYTVGGAKVAAFSVPEGGSATVDMQNNFFTDTTGYYPGDDENNGGNDGNTTTTTTTKTTTASNNNAQNGNNNGTAVQTGDDSDMMPYVMMMIIAGTIAAAALLRRKIQQ